MTQVMLKVREWPADAAVSTRDIVVSTQDVVEYARHLQKACANPDAVIFQVEIVAKITSIVKPAAIQVAAGKPVRKRKVEARP